MKSESTLCCSGRYHLQSNGTLHSADDVQIEFSDNQEADPTNEKTSKDIARVMYTKVDAAITVEQGPDDEK